MLAVCGTFASFLFAALCSNSDPNLFAKLAPFSDPRQGPEKGSLSFFSRQCPNWGRGLGPKFGVQIWDPILGAQIWAHLAMLFWLLVCARRACNSPNKYALPRGGRAGCGHDICLMDQSNRSNIFSTVFRDVNLAAATGCSTVL